MKLKDYLANNSISTDRLYWWLGFDEWEKHKPEQSDCMFEYHIIPRKFYRDGDGLIGFVSLGHDLGLARFAIVDHT